MDSNTDTTVFFSGCCNVIFGNAVFLIGPESSPHQEELTAGVFPDERRKRALIVMFVLLALVAPQICFIHGLTSSASQALNN